ncbi:MAG: hypothetical protein QOF55_1418, partial [Thermoleophilaceae bacterium]|nr:hypothetical protein [Thermoleophilaceae bacterium]
MAVDAPATSRSPRRRRVRRLRRPVLLVLGAAVLTLFTWYSESFVPGDQFEGPWVAAIAMGTHDGLTFGRDVIFTDGPLGFLRHPQVWYPVSGTLALLYKLLFRAALAVLLYRAARRSYGIVASFMVTLAVASAVTDPVTVVFLVGLVLALERDVADRLSLAVAAVAGAVAGVELLTRISLGIECVALTAVFVAALPRERLRHVLVGGGAALLALLVGWTATGQDWSGIGDYVVNSARIASGYSSAMTFEDPALRWQYSAALFAFAVGVAAVVQATGRSQRRVRLGLLGLWVVFAFMSFKEGFVRHDPAHATLFFEAVAGAFVALRWGAGRRLVGLGLTAALLTLVIVARNETISTFVAPFDHADAAVTELEPVFDPGVADRAREEGRAATRARLPLDPQTLSLLTGHTVHIAPTEAPVAWAYGLRWDTLPVFAAYSAYTQGLDAVNEQKVRSRSAPERILVHAEPPPDTRVGSFDQPATMRAIFCGYVEMRVTPLWQVLGRGANRCGPARLLGTVRADWGQAVPVPPPPDARSFVYVGISGAGVGGLERIRSAFYKAREREISLDGVAHRLIPGTATDGLLLRADPAIDYSPPFALAPNPSTISVSLKDSGRSGGTPLRYDFFSAP